MNRLVRKPSMWFLNISETNLSCTSTEEGQRLEILDLGSRGIVLSAQRKQRRD